MNTMLVIGISHIAREFNLVNTLPNVAVANAFSNINNSTKGNRKVCLLSVELFLFPKLLNDHFPTHFW